MLNLKRNLIILSVVAALTLLAAGCAASTASQASENTVKPVETKADDTLKAFTKEELKKYNGQDGNPAYVAVDGIVYDVTNSGMWDGGKHNGFEAGNDLTEAIKTKSPHGVSKLKGVPIIGKLAD